ncbi:peptidase M24 [Rhodobacterales bacterium 52_120_T64]|nr:peptidase M24 [Rhodobacterales bacterium 52_120_T64]
MSEPDFPISEFEDRLNRVQIAMHTEKLDALFFTTEAEMRYFTGFRTLFWQSPTRPWFLIVPVSGRPIAIIPQIGADLMSNTWVEDIRTWSSPHVNDDGVSLLIEALTTYEAIGMMRGRESSLRMPLYDYQRVLDGLPRTELKDASLLVQRLMQIKSPAEIDKISRICQIASDAFAGATELFYEGQPMKEVFRNFKMDLLRRGADDVPYLVGGADYGGYSDVISPPSNRPIAAGDVLMLDTGATLDGYFCDFNRNFFIGQPSEKVKRAYATLYKATDAAFAIARPGVTCAELYTSMAKVIDQEGGDVGRLGHGLGTQLTESPSIVGFDQTKLRAGMVMTLEPCMVIEGQKIMVHEENILINTGPPRLLTKRAPVEIPVIG